MSNVQILTLMPKKIQFLFRKNSSTQRVQKILVAPYWNLLDLIGTYYPY